MNKILINIFLFLSVGCVTNVLHSDDVENYYNSIVGTRVVPAMYTPKYGWNKIYEDSSTYDVEMIKKSGCSYAIKIEKLTNIVLSWNFTSKRERCDGNYIQRI